MSIDGFAVDLGGTKMAAARIENGRVVVKVQDKTDPAAQLEAQIDKMAALLGSIGYVQGSPLGVAVAGRVDHEGNWHAVNTNTLSAISAAPLGAMLAERFGPRSCAINDAAAAAVAEAKLGAGQGAYNFAYITVSTGVGGGLVLGGKLVESSNGLAGHVGFVSSPYGSNLCGSGRVGTVESVTGGKAIAAAAGCDDAKAVFESGEHDAIIALAAASIGTLVTDLTSVLGLDRVAIGGSIGLAPGFIERVENKVSAEPKLFRTEICAAALGHDSGLVGALIHCLGKR
jgi:N-acylmannosamine kinase